jgi:feruloyl esterase
MGGEGQRPSAPPLKRDSKHDIFLAMVEWVEQDKEPQTLVATKYSEDDVSQGTAFTRPVCIVSFSL